MLSSQRRELFITMTSMILCFFTRRNIMKNNNQKNKRPLYFIDRRCNISCYYVDVLFNSSTIIIFSRVLFDIMMFIPVGVSQRLCRSITHQQLVTWTDRLALSASDGSPSTAGALESEQQKL